MESDDIVFFRKHDDSFYEELDNDLDCAIAFSLQEQYNKEVSSTLKETKSSSSTIAKPMSIVDPQWELIDPNPDIHALFLQFNANFFWHKLAGIEVRWSPRMTVCAGVCCYEGRGRLCSVRLSLPLLKLRPRKDLVETLLHEMIHAYLFVTDNNKDHDGHGPEFSKHMHRINKETGTNITIYHNFHDEVDVYRVHWWKCNGPCSKLRPFYGVVKRSMNRAPGPNDKWWAKHQETCNGVFVKIKEPENFSKKNSKRKNEDNNSQAASMSSITKFFPPIASQRKDSFEMPDKIKKIDNSLSDTKSLQTDDSVFGDSKELHTKDKYPKPFSGRGVTLGSSSGAPQSLLSKIRRDIGISSFSNSKKSINSGAKSKDKFTFKDLDFTSCFDESSSASHINNYAQGPLDNFLTSKSKTESYNLNKPLQKTESPIIVACPVCTTFIPEDLINKHLDECIQKFP